VLALLCAVTLLGTGCGAAHRSARSSSAPSQSAPAKDAIVRESRPTKSYDKLDGDSDTDDEHPRARGDDEQPLLRSYGPRASAQDARAVAALVTGYYAVSAAGQAVRACSLLDAAVLAGLLATRPQGTGGCAAALAPLLREQHPRLLEEEVSTMRVLAVHVRDDVGLAVLGFRHTPESQIVLKRERGAWKLDALFGAYMP
jgi:hypothetical protein